MGNPELVDQAVAIATALAELGVGIDDRVLIMLPDGPGFDDAIAEVISRGALPLTVNPELAAADVAAIAVETAAGLVLISAERVHALADLEVQPPIPVAGPQGLWAAFVRLR
jgi:acyl-CoA synthetase (AMP-forming)/AMP-acid ligase II